MHVSLLTDQDRGWNTQPGFRVFLERRLEQLLGLCSRSVLLYRLMFLTQPKIWSYFLVPRLIKSTVNLYSCMRYSPSFEAQI